MKYSDTTNKNGIVQRMEFLCGKGDGAISGDTTLLMQFTGLANQAYFEVWAAELSVDKDILADDYNYADYPDAPIAIVAGQSNFTIPVAVTGGNVASFLRLKGVYYLLNGERQYLRPMDDGETRSDTAGEPDAFRLNGKSLFFNRPFSSAAATKYTNFYVEFQRVPDAFLYTDTTQQPGFIETYHDLIPLRASSLYLMGIPEKANIAQGHYNQFLQRLELFKADVARTNGTVRNRLSAGTQNNK